MKKISSLRISPRSRSKQAASPPLSLPSDLTDGPAIPEVEVTSSSAEKVGSRVESRVESSGDHLQKAKRKEIILNYHQDTVSLDSVSVSSTSEFSSATGTDDRSTCSPLGDGESSLSSVVDSVGGGRVCLNGGDGVLGTGFSFSADASSLEISGSSFLTVDSGITLDRPSAMSFASTLDGKGSSQAQVLLTGKGSAPPRAHSTGKGSSATRHSHVPKAQEDYRNGFDSELEGRYKLDDTLPGSSQNGTRSALEEDDIMLPGGSENGTLKSERTISSGSGTIIESGSSTLRSNDTSPSPFQALESEESCSLNPEGIGAQQPSGQDPNLSFAKRETISNAESTSIGVCGARDPNHADLSPCTDAGRHCRPVVASGKGESKDSNHLKSPRQLPSQGYANIEVDSGGGSILKAGSEHSSRNQSRKRSKSSSPYVRKKPKPLPRKSLKKQATVDEIFLSSLPPNFKPAPLPRSSAGVSSNGRLSLSNPPKRKVLNPSPPDAKFRTPEQQGSSNFGSPQRMVLSNSSTPKHGGYREGSDSSGDPSTPSHGISEPCTPLIESSNPSTPSHGISEPCTPLLESSNPSSPLYESSTSTFSSDVESSISGPRPAGAVTSDDPIPPPRRKRKSKYHHQRSSKDATVLPVSPEESLSRLPGSADQSHDQSHDHPDGGARPAIVVHSSSMDSHDQENKSHDLAEEEEDILNNLLLEETSDPPSKEREAPLVDRMSHLSIDSSCRTSRASLTVFAPDSVPSMALGTSSRPYSFISPGVSAYHFDFSGSYERSNGDRLSGGHTLPKSAVGVTWSPRGQLLHDRKSLKAIIPASSKICI